MSFSLGNRSDSPPQNIFVILKALRFLRGESTLHQIRLTAISFERFLGGRGGEEQDRCRGVLRKCKHAVNLLIVYVHVSAIRTVAFWSRIVCTHTHICVKIVCT